MAGHPHTSTNNLTNAWHQQVNALRECLVTWHTLHVKRFDLPREGMQQNRHTQLVRHFPLCRLGNIIADLVRLSVLVGDVVLVQVRNGVFVVQTQEWALRWLEAGVELLN